MKKKKGRRKKIIIISTVIVLIAVIIFFNLRAQREKATKVTAEKVQRQDLTSIVSASGEVKPKKNVNISAQLTGVHRIIKIAAEEGQRVKAGDFLLKLESTQYEAVADRNRALIRSFKSDLIQAEVRLKKDESYFYRQKKLYEEKLISGEQLEAAKAQYDISYAQHESIRHQIRQAEASLQSALDDLNKTIYYSPIDGIITSLRYEEGEIVVLSTFTDPVLMTIADLSVMEVEVEVDETDVINVKLRQSADVRIDAFPNLTILGKVTEVGISALQKVTASEESKDFKVVVTLENPPDELKPGLSASADIITAEEKDVLTVPISALVLREKEGEEKEKKEGQEEGVYVVEESRVKFRPVKKGIMGEMTVEIVSGLKEGEEIVVGPYDALRQLKDGVLIKSEEKQKKG